jgi:SAM-dependent methyltransferase
MQLRNCPICKSSYKKAKLFMRENIDHTKVNSMSFASRKIPELMNHQLVHCSNCDLVYANKPPSQLELSNLYHQADYDSSEEANDAALAYINAIKPYFKNVNSKQSALEIGTGSGIFLKHLLNLGFQRVIGVEPSLAAIKSAPKEIRKLIRHDIFRANDFKKNSFDLICCFMTMEHVNDPLTLAKEAFVLLRPGGLFITVTHDYKSIVNKILGKKSPIIDIEHMQIFSQSSMNYLLKSTNYKDIETKSFFNSYSFYYWIKIFPLPLVIKKPILTILNKLKLSKIKIKMNVGNFISIGQKNAK